MACLSHGNMEIPFGVIPCVSDVINVTYIRTFGVEETNAKMLMEASYCDDSFASLTEETLMQASYFADEMQAATNDQSRGSFGDSALFDVQEETIEASIYEETFEAYPKKNNNEELDGELNEVKMSFKPFNMTLQLKGKLAILLCQRELRVGEFCDLNLHTMSTLNSLNHGNYTVLFFNTAFMGVSNQILYVIILTAVNISRPQSVLLKHQSCVNLT